MATLCQTITSSTTWSFPKTGVWKVITIGGGGGGYSYCSSTDTSTGGSGGTTSFGSYLSSSGGSAGSTALYSSITGYAGTGLIGSSGINGYNGGVEYGSTSGLPTGLGFGASGGAYCKSYSSLETFKASAGSPGQIKTLVADFTSGTSVTCTIGAAGSAKTGTVSQAFAGSAGAIILQYLGES